jgi:ribosomal protein S12 methylthiotransferase
VIVGFPGESEGQFGELVEFIKWARFDALGCFRFYRESGTVAAEMGGQVPDEVKQRRYDELMLTQQQIAFAKNKKRVGSMIDCLVDAVGRKKGSRGRYYGQAPDIDSVCIIQNCRSEAGEFVNAKVVGVKDYDLVVRQP